MDMDTIHTAITIPTVTPITGRIAMDTITGPTIGTAATAFTIIRGTTTITAGKHSPAAAKTRLARVYIDTQAAVQDPTKLVCTISSATLQVSSPGLCLADQFGILFSIPGSALEFPFAVPFQSAAAVCVLLFGVPECSATEIGRAVGRSVEDPSREARRPSRA